MQPSTIIERCLRLEQAAWAELIGTHRSLVLGVLMRILGHIDRDSIPDLEQEVFEKLLANDCQVLRTVEGDAHLRGLLAMTAANLARDHLRRLGVRRGTGLDAEGADEIRQALAPDPVAELEEEVARKRRVEKVFEVLAALVSGPNASRDTLIFRAHYLDELSAPEIASMGIGLTTKGVETVLFRLTKRLRASLREDEESVA